MATKAQVLDLHRKHPDWNSMLIGEALDCEPAYVRATFQRNGLTLPSGNLIRELGRAALAAGLTVADLKKLSKRAA